MELSNVSVLDTRRKILLNTPHIDTSVGDLVTFNTDLRAPLKSCKVSFLPVQEGEGDPSPDNVRNITGWNGVEVNRCGKNLAHIFGYGTQNITDTDVNKYKTTNTYGTTINTTIFNNPDTPLIIEQSQAPDSTAPNSFRNGYIAIGTDNLIFGQKYNVSFKVSNITNNILNTSLNKIRLLAPNGSATSVTEIIDDVLIFKSITFSQNTAAPKRKGFEIRICGFSFTLSEFMVTAVDNDDFTYEPYQGTTISVDWTDSVGTIYGGYVDLISGELVEEWHSITFDGDSIKVNRDYMNLGDTDYIKAYWVYFSPAGISNTHCKCNTLKITYTHNKSYIPQTPCLFLSRNGYTFGGLILGKKEDYPELAEGTAQDRIDAINNWFRENPTQVIYKLAEPIHYQLTPQQLSTLKGINNVYSNTNGQIEIKYWKH